MCCPCVYPVTPIGSTYTFVFACVCTCVGLCLSLQEELVIAQGEATRLRSLLRQKESEVMQINEVVTKLNRERDNISDIVRQEFADR